MHNLTAVKPHNLDYKISAENPAKDILNLFAAYTPQFYKYSSERDKQKELNKIAFMIDGIHIAVLNKMCELCIKSYKLAISYDRAVRINLDYFLSFYIKAFNATFSKTPETPYRLISSELDEDEGYIRTVYELMDDRGNVKETFTAYRIPEASELERIKQKRFGAERIHTAEQLSAECSSFEEALLQFK